MNWIVGLYERYLGKVCPYLRDSTGGKDEEGESVGVGLFGYRLVFALLCRHDFCFRELAKHVARWGDWIGCWVIRWDLIDKSPSTVYPG